MKMIAGTSGQRQFRDLEVRHSHPVTDLCDIFDIFVDFFPFAPSAQDQIFAWVFFGDFLSYKNRLARWSQR